MKHILLLRHAKSSHEDSSLDDIDRPLTDRGRNDASRMGDFVRRSGYVPDIFFSSTAVRARQTAELFAESAGFKEPIRWDEELYYGTCFDYLAVVQSCGDSLMSVLVVGHNPKVEETASLLCSDQQSYIARMPTTALICFEHPATKWKQIKKGTARIKWMVIPKLLRGNNP